MVEVSLIELTSASRKSPRAFGACFHTLGIGDIALSARGTVYASLEAAECYLLQASGGC